MKYWLFKTEPSTYSLTHLQQQKITMWEGVRNYQARNFLRQCRRGDLVFMYHSNATPTGIVGIGKIVKVAYPDPTQFDPKSKYYDSTSNLLDPRWSVVDVAFVSKLSRCISLQELQENQHLAAMRVVQKGNRLSIMPVSEHEWQIIVKMTAQ